MTLGQLKSALQKNVRRGRREEAVNVAAALLRKDVVQFVRRFMIIVLEDAVLHPDFPLLSWLTEKGCPWPELPYSEFGHVSYSLEIVQFMLEKGLKSKCWVLGAAVYSRCVGTLDWLKENGYTEGVLDDKDIYFLVRGHEDDPFDLDEGWICTFEWLHANGFPITESVLRDFEDEEEAHNWLKCKLYEDEKGTASRRPPRGGKRYCRKQVESAPAVKKARRS